MKKPICFLLALTFCFSVSTNGVSAGFSFTEEFNKGLPSDWMAVYGTFWGNGSLFDEMEVSFQDGRVVLSLTETSPFSCGNDTGTCYSTAGHIQSPEGYGYGTYEAVVQVPESYSGEVAGAFFLYDKSGNEIDFAEFINGGIQTNVHKDDKQYPKFLFYDELGINPGDWITVKVFYEKSKISWYINAHLVRFEEYSRRSPLPLLNGKIMFNIWQGNPDNEGVIAWLGGQMPEGITPVQFRIESVSYEAPLADPVREPRVKKK